MIIRFAQACIIFGLVAMVQGASNTTSIATDVTSVTAANETTSNITKKGSPRYVFSNHKPVIIINDNALRTRNKNGHVSSLKYIEYDDDGAPLNTVFMYNLNDVAKFFEIYLDTIICHGECID